MLKQLCIQAHSSSLRCGGSLCKVQHDKLYNASHCKSKCAFTLAEVLITLVIIGIIAALTIPTLMKKYQDFVLETQRKKAYSEFLNIYNLALKNGEFVEEMRSFNDVKANFKVLQEKLRVAKSCNNALSDGCWVDSCNIDGDCFMATATQGQASTIGFVDAAGRQWIQYKPEIAFLIIVDVNGDKGPNRLGKDRFGIEANKNWGIHNGVKGSNLMERPKVYYK